MYIFQPDRYLLREQIRAVAHYMCGRILDVGAGERSRYDDFFTYSEYIRMDVSHGSNVDVVGSADAIPFKNEEFDSVISTQVFEHLIWPTRAAGEIARVIKKGGYLLITVPQMNELHEEPHDYFRYTKYGLTNMFEEVGFELVSINQRGGFYSTLTQICVRYISDKFNLYQHALIGRLFSKSFYFIGRVAIWLDSCDMSKANRVHTIGWCAIFKKK